MCGLFLCLPTGHAEHPWDDWLKSAEHPWDDWLKSAEHPWDDWMKSFALWSFLG
jgi:hypothetical protein